MPKIFEKLFIAHHKIYSSKRKNIKYIVLKSCKVMTTDLSTLLQNSKIFITTPVVGDRQQQEKRVSPQRLKKETREFPASVCFRRNCASEFGTDIFVFSDVAYWQKSHIQCLDLILMAHSEIVCTKGSPTGPPR
jgi:hypothetical protein